MKRREQDSPALSIGLEIVISMASDRLCDYGYA